MVSLLIYPSLPDSLTIDVLCLLVVICLAIYGRTQQKTVFFLASFFLGIIWFAIAAHRVLEQQLPQSLENTSLIIEGQIATLPVLSNGVLQFQFAISKVCEKKVCRPLHLNSLLTWQSPPDNVRISQIWQLPVKLKRPHTYANPGSFDREAWLLQNRLRATGAVYQAKHEGAPVPRLLANKKSIARIRQYYDRQLLAILNNEPFAGVIDALTVGNSAAISQDQWKVFRNTGTSHLIAISGLHIGMIAGLFYLAGIACWRLSAYLCARLPAQKAGAIFGMIGAFSYTAFSGFSIPAERTLIMIITWMGSLLMSRYSSSLQRFMLGLGCVLILNPFSVMNSGFWLSFSAIALIGYGMSGRLSDKSLWWRYGRVQWVASIGLMPLSWLLFQQSSIIGLFANMLAIPWVGFVTVPLALLACLLLPINNMVGQHVLLLSEKTLEWLWPYLHYLATLPNNSWFLGLHTSWLILPLMIAVLLILAPLHFPGRWLALIWFCPALFIRPAKLPENAVKLTVLDVGQGLSVVIQTRTHTAVYDTGMGYPDGYNMGDVVLLPFFRVEHISKLNKLIISHPDADHSGGANAVLQQFKTVPMLVSVIDQFKKQEITACEAGQTWVWDEVTFRILYPFQGQARADNNSSCVLQIEVNGKQILLPGDIEKAAEAELVAQYHQQLASYLLIAPHHGSRTSSSDLFIQAVNPKVVVFATGYLNRYHFPSDQAVMRYQRAGGRLYNSAYDGAITVTFMPDKPVEVHTYRKDYSHFW